MRSVKEIKQEIEDLNKELQIAQDNCGHNQIVYEHKSNTGNYDPCQDSYWVEVECLCCDKKFSYEDYESMYTKFDKVFGKDLSIKREDYLIAKRKGLLQ